MFSGIVLVCLLLAVLEEVGVIPPASKDLAQSGLEENDMNLFLRQIYHGPTKEVIDGFVGGQDVRLSCRAEYNAYRHGLSSAELSLLSKVEYVDEQRQCLPAEYGDSHIVCYTHEANECYLVHKYPDLARNSDVHLSFESRAVQSYCRVTATSWDQVLLSVG